MITVQILQAEDRIDPSDWCRPLTLCTMSGGMSDHMSFKSCYTGAPENNVQWVRVRDVIGECWFGRAVGEFNVKLPPMEFVRGEVPVGHRLNMRDYNSIAEMTGANHA